MWRFNDDEHENSSPHASQMRFKTSICVSLICDFRYLCVRKVLSHCSHWNVLALALEPGFFWQIFSCCLRLPLKVNCFIHELHSSFNVVCWVFCVLVVDILSWNSLHMYRMCASGSSCEPHLHVVYSLICFWTSWCKTDTSSPRSFRGCTWCVF